MRILLLLALSFLLPTAALAQANSDAETCTKSGSARADDQIAVCTRAINAGQLSTQNLAIVLYDRGNAWRRKNDLDRAIADYSEAIRLNPQYANAYGNRGIAWYGKGDNDRAIADYSQALRIDPQRANFYFNRGNAWIGKGDKDRAIADYSEAIRLNPQYAFAYNGRGAAWVGKGDDDRAIADYGEAVRLDPQYEIAFHNRGRAWQHKGDNDRAIADFSEAIRLGPQDAEAYDNRGSAWQRKGDNARAIADFSEAIRLGPGEPGPYNNLGWLLATSKSATVRDGKHAVELAQKACELTGWKDPDYIDTLAVAYAEAGNFGEAIRWQEKTLEFPEFSKANGENARARIALYREQKPYHE
jgi:tetratricopeptide (TPR) repeat protein